MSDTPTPAAQAFVAAEDLAHATAVLLRFAREGASTDCYPFGLDDITPALAKALLFVLRTELEALGDDPEDATEREQGGQLCAALAKWLIDANTAPVPD